MKFIPDPSIRLLSVGNNERGDLFTRLTQDLFFALGYDELRLNVHKSGRELDVQGVHRFEPRRLIAECKAQTAKIGGDDLNKFFGVVTRERLKANPASVAGYFVSLSGFTETGIEQEADTGADKTVLLNAQQVVNELERGRVIVTRQQAAERAGQCVQNSGIDVSFLALELLGHERGYIWSVYYGLGQEITHFSLIHADGDPLSESISSEVVKADNACHGKLRSLSYIHSVRTVQDRRALVESGLNRYKQWIGEECGYIQLDGMPADTDLSAARLKLERLFIPLKARLVGKDDDHPDVQQTVRETSFPLGDLLSGTPHLAVLAMPGGGKSTLLKRLATAYAFPERRGELQDALPDREWLPLILRCRELRDRAHRPILELLDDVPRHAGMNRDECSAFRDYLHERLRAGTVLLLIDGLDEISDEGARQTFTNHLRTFIAIFPQSALIVTSREAGFRLVANVIAGACLQVKLAPLDEDDVVALCERWHTEVLSDNERVRGESKELGRSMWNNQRIRTLVENPLLLTTLLVVKRCVGELPRSRTTLYREAIRVLVRTWNVEGYAPLDEDETLAQLSYVACAMMHDGKQQIGERALLSKLSEARRELEAELQFAQISPHNFLNRVEYRSSLLMQVGHARIDNCVQPAFEFRHLTFQEYLAARGYVEEQYPGRENGAALADILEPFFDNEQWREVITLAAVLAGRKAEDIIKRITAACRSKRGARAHNRYPREEPHERLLYQCIRDEVQVTPPTLRAALLELACGKLISHLDDGWVASIMRGKFGTLFRQVTEERYLSGGSDFHKCNSTMADIAAFDRFGAEKPVLSDAVAAILKRTFEHGARIEKIYAALVLMRLAYGERSSNPEASEQNAIDERKNLYGQLVGGLAAMISHADAPSSLAASWALAWIGEKRLLKAPPDKEVIIKLYNLWRGTTDQEQARYAVWAFGSQEMLTRDSLDSTIWGDCDSFLEEIVVEQKFYHPRMVYGALVVAWYRQKPWSDVQLVELVKSSVEKMARPIEVPTVNLLSRLGRSGEIALADLQKRSGKGTAGRIRARNAPSPR